MMVAMFAIWYICGMEFVMCNTLGTLIYLFFNFVLLLFCIYCFYSNIRILVPLSLFILMHLVLYHLSVTDDCAV